MKLLMLIATASLAQAREMTFEWDKPTEAVSGHVLYVREKDVWVKVAEIASDNTCTAKVPDVKFDAAVSAFIQVGESRIESAKSGLISVPVSPSIPKGLKLK